MKRCRKSSEHKLAAVADPEVKIQQCGMSSVWSPEGIRDIWLCCHHLACEKCGVVISDKTPCPDNKGNMLQDRRWR